MNQVSTNTRSRAQRFSRSIGFALREELMCEFLSLGATAEITGMTPARLSSCLNGRGVFTINELDAVCTFLGVGVVDVVHQGEAIASALAAAELLALRGPRQ